MKLTNRIATYLSKLSEAEYGVSTPVASVVNYFIDGYFHKLDERVLAASQIPRKYYPADLGNHIRELWLGCEAHKTFTLNNQYPSYLRAQTAWAFTRMLNNFVGEGGSYEIVPFLDSYEFKEELKNDYKFKLQSAQLEVALGHIESLPVFGTMFISRVSDGKKLVLNIDLCYDGMGCSFAVQTNPNDQAVAEQFFVDLQNSISVNDIYRNKCLTFHRGVLGFQLMRPTTWDDVIINPDLKDRIQKNSSGLMKNMETLSNIGFPVKRNSLLISPPGMAKTTMFRAISNDLEGSVSRIWCTGKSIEYAEHVSALFEAARGLAPCIIFIEDMDLFGSERQSHGGSNYVLNEFLAQLDGVGVNSGVVVLASTNDFNSLDVALSARPGRFNDKIIIPKPDAGERGQMIMKFFKIYNARRGQSITDDTWQSVINLTDGFTGDYIREVVDTAVLCAADAGRCVGKNVIIEADDLLKAGTRTMENYQLGQQAKHYETKITQNDKQV